MKICQMWTITQNDTQASKNEKVIGEMYPYQLSTLGFMETFEKRNFTEKTSDDSEEINIKTNIGILANNSGSGKTRILLALIANNKNNCLADNEMRNSTDTSMVFQENVAVSANSVSYNSGDSFAPAVTLLSKKSPEFPENSVFTGSSLVICSKLNFNNWSSEIKKAMSPSFGVYYVDTNKIAEAWPRVYEISRGEHKLVLCSSSFYNKLVKCSTGMVWDRVIIDDPEFMKSINEDVKTRFTWLVTSTPEKLKCIRGRSMITRALGNIDNCYDYFTIKCNDEYSKQFSDSRLQIQNYIVEHVREEYINVLRSHFSPEVRRLVQEKKYEEAVIKMGGSVMSEKCIIDTYTRTTEAKIAELTREGNVEDKNRLEARLQGIKEKISNIKNETCGVCFSELETPIMTKCCNNFVCMECMHESLKYKACCVYCRTSVTFSDTVLVSEKILNVEEPGNSENRDLGDKKSECIKLINELLTNNGNVKTVIVASRSIREINLELSKNNIRFSDVASCRNANNVKRALCDFRSTFSGTNLLLLGAYDTISGIDLSNVDNLIFYDSLPCNTIKQIIGKACSMSRTEKFSVNIFNFSMIAL